MTQIDTSLMPRQGPNYLFHVYPKILDLVKSVACYKRFSLFSVKYIKKVLLHFALDEWAPRQTAERHLAEEHLAEQRL